MQLAGQAVGTRHESMDDANVVGEYTWGHSGSIEPTQELGEALPPERIGAIRKLVFLEHCAKLLRSLGLGRFVDYAARRAGSQLGRFDLDVEGIRLTGAHVGQLYYARELVASGRESFFRSLFVDSIQPGATVLEGGPYIGYFTALAASAVGVSGKVVAVEPNPEALPSLRANVLRNGAEEQVEVVQAALSDSTGSASFFVTEGGDTSSLHRPEHRADQVTVGLVRGDDLLGRVDVVKLDVEGNEVAALRGMSSLLESCRPVLFCECNPSMLESAGVSESELLSELDRLRYSVQWIDERSRTLRPLAERWDGGYVNLLCLPR